VERVALYIPKNLNDGRPVAKGVLESYEDELFEIALDAGENGFTRSSIFGMWRFPDGTKFREPVIKYELDVSDSNLILDRVLHLAERVREELRQDAVYVTVSPIEAHLVTERVPA
jgi:hypothetical protein